jgi:hypothetical protein
VHNLANGSLNLKWACGSQFEFPIAFSVVLDCSSFVQDGTLISLFNRFCLTKMEFLVFIVVLRWVASHYIIFGYDFN